MTGLWTKTWLVIAVLLTACGDTCASRPERAPTSGPPRALEVMPYGELVKRAQGDVLPTETRTKLACADAFADANAAAAAASAAAPTPDRDGGDDSPLPDDWYEKLQARHAQLDRLGGPQLLKAADDDDLYFTLIGRIDRARTSGSAVATAERDLELVTAVDGEVNNGGLHQYFFNSSGDEAVMAQDALLRVGAATHQKILGCALTAFPLSRPSTERGKRNHQLARWGDRQFDIFEELDSAWYDAPSLTTRMGQLIRAHPERYPLLERPKTP